VATTGVLPAALTGHTMSAVGLLLTLASQPPCIRRCASSSGSSNFVGNRTGARIQIGGGRYVEYDEDSGPFHRAPYDRWWWGAFVRAPCTSRLENALAIS